jgi:hypothetical protein
MLLDKEYQQRRLLDAFLTGAMIKFERRHDHSLLLQASVQNLKAWDPDMTKPTSDRNRHILRQIQHGEENISPDPFFSFQYKTFNTFPIKVTEQVPFADWVEITEDIDDILTVKSRPFEFVYCRDTISELTDYLNNGLPGELLSFTFSFSMLPSMINSTRD